MRTFYRSTFLPLVKIKQINNETKLDIFFKCIFILSINTFGQFECSISSNLMLLPLTIYILMSSAKPNIDWLFYCASVVCGKWSTCRNYSSDKWCHWQMVLNVGQKYIFLITHSNPPNCIVSMAEHGDLSFLPNKALAFKSKLKFYSCPSAELFILLIFVSYFSSPVAPLWLLLCRSMSFQHLNISAIYQLVDSTLQKGICIYGYLWHEKG